MLENTESQEMYLTTIYALQKKNGMVRSVDVADERGYSKVSVHNAANNVSYSVKDVHDTVIGKILLATFGCIPAYDKYVVAGMKTEGLCGTLGKRSLSDLVDYSRTHASIVKQIMTSVNADVQRESGCSTLIYPVAKILDMLFWEYGYDIL